MIEIVIILSVAFLFMQIYTTITHIFNESKFENLLEAIQFNDSKEGRILGLLFWNLIPILPIVFVIIKVIIYIAIEDKWFSNWNFNIERIKNQIKGSSK